MGHEDVDCRPVNPYGTTKLAGEQMVPDAARTAGCGTRRCGTSTSLGRRHPS
ncbi:hypothetical protein [Blastococcus sp. TF02A-26]|uniref:hypothetical protein n=1 Tax=Blastococcus sp. TF02A-26 TaxID=2250577 RepID=UPI003517DB4C